jgi:hypothetical protein
MERRWPLTPSMAACIMERKLGGGKRGNGRPLRRREMRGRAAVWPGARDVPPVQGATARRWRRSVEGAGTRLARGR